MKTYPSRLVVLVNMLAIVPLGYMLRFSPSLPEYLRDPLGSICYEIFWILLVIFIYPPVDRQRAAIGVCLASCAIEFLQLYQPPWLQAIRATLPGRLVLGTDFARSDLPVYIVGSWLGWLWVKGIDRWLARQQV